MPTEGDKYAPLTELMKDVGAATKRLMETHSKFRDQQLQVYATASGVRQLVSQAELGQQLDEDKKNVEETKETV